MMSPPPGKTARKAALTAGFTLIELSIVLVIIGLIVGGVLVGRDLIHAAQIQTIITDKDRYITAANTFVLKYSALPGDMPNATSFWGASNCPYGPSGGTLTCNGDGDGQIGSGAYINSGPGGGAPNEPLLAWQHLSNAGLVAGSYTGFITGSPNPIWMPGVNMPQSRSFANAGFTLFYYGTMPNYYLFFTSSGIGHVIMFGAQSPNIVDNWTGAAAYPVLSTLDAYTIDAKIDDGKPGTGSVFSLPKGSAFAPGGASACTTGIQSAALTAIYDSTQVGPQCALFFNAGF
jgi:prepilin-type N-terminal cleavage/methylation domain-containing protein